MKALPTSDLVLTGSSCDASINVWSTRAGLTRLFGMNFKLQVHIDPRNNIQRAQLYFLNYEVQETASGAKIYLRDPAVLEKEAQGDQATGEEAAQEVEKGDGELMQAMFDESAATGEALPLFESVPSEACQLEDLQSEYEKELIEHTADDIEDPFSAIEIGEEKSKEAAVQQKESKKKGPNAEKASEKAEKKASKLMRKLQKEDKLTEVSKPVEPDAEFLRQLMDMGFPEELGKKALMKVKNESVTAAVDAVVSLQVEQDGQREVEPPKVEKKTVVKWSCEMCTMLNQPGGTKCHICFSAAPATAYVDEAAERAEKEAEEKRKTEDEERVARAKAEEEERKKQEDLERLREEQSKEKIRQEFQRTQQFLERATVSGFLFSSVKKGKDRRPAVLGAVLTDREEAVSDVHLRCLEYTKEYLANFICATPGVAPSALSRLTKEEFASDKECLERLLCNNQQLVESLYPALADAYSFSATNSVLRSVEIGVVRLPLKEVSLVCQMGSDLSPTQPLHTLIFGRKADSTAVAFLITMKSATSAAGQTTIRPEVTELSDKLFEDLKIDEIQDVRFCSETSRLVVQSARGVSVYSWTVEEGSLATEHLRSLATSGEDAEAVKVEQGLAFIKEKDTIAMYRLLSEEEAEPSRKEEAQVSVPKEKEESKLTEGSAIEPEKVTVQDIKEYEDLMKGKAVSARSNAHAPRGQVTGSSSSQPLYRRHNWLANGEEEFGPMQMKFETSTSLISLNIDLTFSCTDAAGLQDQRDRTKNEAKAGLADVDVVRIEDSPEEPKPEEALRNLGQFSVKGVNSVQLGEEGGALDRSQAAQPSSAQQKDDGSSYLPLIVHKHKGAQFNSTHWVNTIVLDNAQVFASNYARPEFYFRHLHGDTMTVEKFTIRSQLISRCGAYPVGRGLIFMADNLEAFELTKPFHKFTAEEYSQWKTARMQDPSPLRPCEPVAFFEFDERPSLTIDIDFKRTCRYIMLKPTGFRSKPHLFRLSVNDLPMELEFFGALGSSQPFDSSADFCGPSDLAVSSKESETAINSGHAILIHDLEHDEEILRINNVHISHLRVGNMALDSSRALGVKGVGQIGQTALRLSDPRISLRTLSGLSVRVIKESTGQAWDLKGVSIVGVITQAGQLPALDRSYLISPKYFSTVNRVLSQMVFDSKYDRALTAYIMGFLTKLIKHDYEFAGLILETVDLRKFIKVNFYTNDQAHIQASVEFLRCFRSEIGFVRHLYEILIEIVQNELPHSVPPQKGYETLIGMLNWVMPLDIERTLAVLVDTFYTTVCKECMPAVQTPEYVDFRTRYTSQLAGDPATAGNFAQHYPFDRALFRPLSMEDKSKSDGSALSKQEESGVTLPNKTGLLRNVVIHQEKQPLCHTFRAVFDVESKVNLVQIYFSEQNQLYKLDVLAYVGSQLVFHEALGESSYARYVRYKRTGQSQKDSAEAKPAPDECLRVPLNCKCQEMTVKLIYSFASTSLTTSASDRQLAVTVAEFYGEPVAAVDPAAAAKEYQQRVEEYEKESAALFSVSKSVQVLSMSDPATAGGKKMIPYFPDKQKK